MEGATSKGRQVNRTNDYGDEKQVELGVIVLKHQTGSALK